MLIRSRIVNPPVSAEDLTGLSVNQTRVSKDPWEEDCGKAIAKYFMLGGDCENEWTAVPAIQHEEGLKIVKIDLEQGFIDQRRPIDLERLERWEKDNSYRISNDQWS